MSQEKKNFCQINFVIRFVRKSIFGEVSELALEKSKNDKLHPTAQRMPYGREAQPARLFLLSGLENPSRITIFLHL